MSKHISFHFQHSTVAMVFVPCFNDVSGCLDLVQTMSYGGGKIITAVLESTVIGFMCRDSFVLIAPGSKGNSVSIYSLRLSETMRSSLIVVGACKGQNECCCAEIS
jgi:hypothetical protein